MRVVPKVTALVLNYNLADATLACVRSLLASTYPNLGVTVVDNGSTDESPPVLCATLAGVAHVITVGENRYFAGGMNVGLRHALAGGCDYALVMNNDTIVEPGMVEALMCAAEALPDAGIVAPRIDAGGRIWSLGGRRRRAWPFPQELARSRRAANNREVARVEFVTGCAMVLSRRLLERVGLFDERYVMYYEDADLCERARAAGFGIYVVPAARMTHLVASSARWQSAQTTHLRTLNRVRFYRQHHQPLWALGHLLIAAQESCRAVTEFGSGNRGLAAARLLGLRDGWRLGAAAL